MNQPRWLTRRAETIHSQLILREGGSAGILDDNALESTLPKPQNLFIYGDHPTIAQLAAAYGYGFVKNHCFCDDNKRIALASIGVFLRLNEYRLTASEFDAVLTITGAAASQAPSEDVQSRLAQWIAQHSTSL
ncbi:MAG: type II toxin-antitoxin system death-on-curing family toxin [Cyanobacteria bacterium P01_A01_bin.3]